MFEDVIVDEEEDFLQSLQAIDSSNQDPKYDVVDSSKDHNNNDRGLNKRSVAALNSDLSVY